MKYQVGRTLARRTVWAASAFDPNQTSLDRRLCGRRLESVVATGRNKRSVTMSALGMDSVSNCVLEFHQCSPADKAYHAAGVLPEEAATVTIPKKLPNVVTEVLLLSSTSSEVSLLGT